MQMELVEEKQVLFWFDAVEDYVPARFVPYLEHYKWLSIHVHQEGLRIFGKRKRVWYSREFILGLLERKYSPKFAFIMDSVEVIPDKTSCWLWTGFAPDGLPAIKVTSHAHSFQTRSVQYTLSKLIRGYRPDKLGMICANPLCVRPGHMTIENFLE